MAWLLDDAVQQVREIVQDTRAASYRYSDARIIGYLNSALSDARRLRPDLFLPDLTAAIPRFTDADLGTNEAFPIDDTYFSAVVDYVAGMVSMSDDEFVIEGRAVVLANRFTQKLIGKGA